MGESTQHQLSLQRIVDYVSETFGNVYSLSALDDLPKRLGEDKPPLIGGYRPDFYARDVPLTTMIIGEAKTSQDIESEHTRKQFTAYLVRLTHIPKGVLIIAVAWRSVAAVRRILTQITGDQIVHGNTVKVVILDEMKEYVILWP